MVKKVYIAGPQVFLQDPMGFFNWVREHCHNRGLEALCPFDPGIPLNPHTIFNHNLKLLREADAAVAYMDPFRGAEPDSGTVWETGFLRGLNKPVFLYGDDERTVEQKHRSYFHEISAVSPIRSKELADKLLPDNMAVESFGYSHNLMLAMSCTYVKGGVLSALNEVGKYYNLPGFVNKEELTNTGT